MTIMHIMQDAIDYNVLRRRLAIEKYSGTTPLVPDLWRLVTEYAQPTNCSINHILDDNVYRDSDSIYFGTKHYILDVLFQNPHRSIPMWHLFIESTIQIIDYETGEDIVEYATRLDFYEIFSQFYTGDAEYLSFYMWDAVDTDDYFHRSISRNQRAVLKGAMIEIIQTSIQKYIDRLIF